MSTANPGALGADVGYGDLKGYRVVPGEVTRFRRFQFPAMVVDARVAMMTANFGRARELRRPVVNARPYYAGRVVALMLKQPSAALHPELNATFSFPLAGACQF